MSQSNGMSSLLSRILLASSLLALASTVASPAQDSSAGSTPRRKALAGTVASWAPDCRNRADYPVIAYDARLRRAKITMRSAARDLQPDRNTTFGKFATENLPSFGSGGFLCDGRPVEVYVFNRRLKTSFTLALTSTFQPPLGTLDVRGISPATLPPAAPAAKGFISNAAQNSTILTTDQAVAALLDDEHFDRIYNRVADDADDVIAQANQLQSNVKIYDETLRRFVGDDMNGQEVTPLGTNSLRGVAKSWKNLGDAILDTINIPAPHQQPLVSEFAFDDWTNRADRLETEVSRLNAKMSAYPIADTLTNLQSSAATLRDNVNDVLSERDAINRALELLYGLPIHEPLRNTGVPAPIWKQRQIAEVRQYLRTHFTSATTITDQTLERIVETYLNNRNTLQALQHSPTCSTVPPPIVDPTKVKPSKAANDHLVQQRYCQAIKELQRFAKVSLPPTMGTIYATAPDLFEQVRSAVAVLNESEASALRSINYVYDNFYGPMLPLNLGLNGASGNLFIFYTVNGAEQFNRYQISSDFPLPQSNCPLSISLNNSTSGALTTCTSAGTPPPPAASYASTAFPLAPAPASGGAAATLTPYSQFSGRVEMHHFSDAALITGIAYEGLKSSSFNWNACPTSPFAAAGNFPGTNTTNTTITNITNTVSATGTTSTTTTTTASNTATGGPGCVSPTATATVTTVPTYYQLVRSNPLPLAAVQGVDIFLLGHQDQFPTAHRRPQPALFLGAAAYPLNHYYGGVSIEPKRGFNITAGVAGVAVSEIPGSFGYVPGSTLGAITTTSTTTTTTTTNTVTNTSSTSTVTSATTTVTSVGSYSTTNPTIQANTRLRAGFFIMIGFDSALFRSIFNLSAFTSGSANVIGAASH